MKLHVLALLASLSPLTAAADPQRDRAAAIEDLSRDPSAPHAEAEDGPGWTLYPQRNLQQWMTVESCQLTINSTLNGRTQSRVDIDLAFATLRRTGEGYPFDYIEAVEGVDGAAGMLTFDMAEGNVAIGRYAGFFDPATSADSPPLELPSVPYIMWAAPPREQVSALAAAILEYQRDFCRPIG